MRKLELVLWSVRSEITHVNMSYKNTTGYVKYRNVEIRNQILEIID